MDREAWPAGAPGPARPPAATTRGLSPVLERNIRALQLRRQREEKEATVEERIERRAWTIALAPNQRRVIVRSVVPLLIGMSLLLFACADRYHERTIVIDPGHGGVDPGAIETTSNILEKEVALRMGLALRDQLEATGRYRVIMTRDHDRSVGRRDRLEIARQSQGELFISLHADSLVSAPEVSGASVYTISESALNDDPAHLASKDDRDDILARIDFSNEEDIDPETLTDLAQREARSESIRLAELLLQELNGATKIVKPQPAQAGFFVLQLPDMPSVLIELGYLSNPADEKALVDAAHIARLTAAVVRAVDVYFEVEPPDYGSASTASGGDLPP
jgi:N-acetylmuramoyl-L-alanine amidase